MNIFEMKYRAGEFSDLISTTPESLRDWRRRGVDVGIAVGVNGQKSYCDYDRLEARIITQLRQDSYAFDSIKDAFGAGRHVTPYVARKLGLDLSHAPVSWMQTIGQWDAKFCLISGKHDFAYTSDLNHFLSKDVMAGYMQPVFTVIDMDHIAQSVRDWVTNQIETEV